MDFERKFILCLKQGQVLESGIHCYNILFCVVYSIYFSLLLEEHKLGNLQNKRYSISQRKIKNL